MTHRRRHGSARRSCGQAVASTTSQPTSNPLDGNHHLLGNTFRGNEDRTQAFMAAHHIHQRRTQSIDIQIPHTTATQPACWPTPARNPATDRDEPQPGLAQTTTAHHRTLLHHQRRHHPTPSTSPDPLTQPATVGASNTARTERSATTAAFTAVTTASPTASPHRGRRRSHPPRPADAEHLRVDPGQDLLDRISGRPVLIGTAVFRRR